MKKIIYIITIMIAGILPSSCDLSTSPTNSVEEGLVFTDVANTEKVLNGTWAYLMETYFSYQNPGWNCLFRASDAMGNDAALITTKYGYAAHYRFDAMNQPNTGTVAAVWTLAYKTIDNCNNVITKIDPLEGDPALKKRAKAQAYALRGYMYLNLATFYSFSYMKDPNAPCVPIYTEPTTSTTEGKKRSTLAQVYSQVISDLENAYNQIGDYDREGQKYKIDKNVISGLLARTYLQMGAWDKATTYAAHAQESYSLMNKNEYLNGFNDYNNNEWIWGHGQIPSQSNASYSFHFMDVSSSAAYYYSFMADPYFKDFFDTNDIRYQLFEWDTKRYSGGLMYKKFKFRSDQTGDIVLMRKAEMILIEAEALAEMGNKAEAIAKLNELRTGRGANTPDLSGLSKEALVEEILIERRKELFGEGFALSDILRRQKSVERKEVPTGTTVDVNGTKISVKGHTVLRFADGNPFIPNSKYYIFTVPITEVTNNPNL